MSTKEELRDCQEKLAIARLQVLNLEANLALVKHKMGDMSVQFDAAREVAKQDAATHRALCIAYQDLLRENHHLEAVMRALEIDRRDLADRLEAFKARLAKMISSVCA